MIIRPVTCSDAADITMIYNHYIENTVVTFEEKTVIASDMTERISDTTQKNMPWFVAENQNGDITGYAYAVPWKGRSAYRFSVEVTVYVHAKEGGKGIGSALYSALFKTLKDQGVHVALGGITLPNPASIALHEKFGMEKVAHIKEVGFKFDQWVDVGYWQIVL